MKLYFIAEATLDDVANRIPIWIKKYSKPGQPPINRDSVEQIALADPTRGKYTEWLINQYLTGRAKFPEDQSKLYDILKLFDQKKSKLKDRDIQKYTPDTLEQALSPQLGLTKSERREARAGELKLPKGSKLILSEATYDVVEISYQNKPEGWKSVHAADDPEAIEASALLCSGTKWCTANQSSAQSYLRRGPLYLIYKGGTRFALIHFPSGQFKNVQNQDLNTDDLIIVCKLIGKALGLEIHQMPVAAYAVVQHRFDQLIPNRVGIELSEEDRQSLRWEKAEPYIADSIYAAKYAAKILGRRWPEAEQAMVEDLAAANANDLKDIVARIAEYTKMVINEYDKGASWEAETVLLDKVAEEYEKMQLKTPDYIAKYGFDPANQLVNYAKAINSKWPEAEEYILLDAFSSAIYARDIIKGPWPKAEPTILKDPIISAFYAMYVLNRRWLEAEEVIKQKMSERPHLADLDIFKQYNEKFLS